MALMGHSSFLPTFRVVLMTSLLITIAACIVAILLINLPEDRPDGHSFATVIVVILSLIFLTALYTSDSDYEEKYVVLAEKHGVELTVREQVTLDEYKVEQYNKELASKRKDVQ